MMLRWILSLIAILSLASAGTTAAQPVGTGSGPVSEISRSVKDGSRPVHERGRSVRDGTVGSMKSGPVRGQRRVGMLSGPVSELSVGPVTAGQPMTGGGSVTESSAGAVKHEMDPSLGEQVHDLQRALGPIQERLREQAEADVLAAEREETEQDVGAPAPEVELEQPQRPGQVQVDESKSDTADDAIEYAEPAAPVESGTEPQPLAEDERIEQP